MPSNLANLELKLNNKLKKKILDIITDEICSHYIIQPAVLGRIDMLISDQLDEVIGINVEQKLRRL